LTALAVHFFARRRAANDPCDILDRGIVGVCGLLTIRAAGLFSTAMGSSTLSYGDPAHDARVTPVVVLGAFALDPARGGRGVVATGSHAAARRCVFAAIGVALVAVLLTGIAVGLLIPWVVYLIGLDSGVRSQPVRNLKG